MRHKLSTKGFHIVKTIPGRIVLAELFALTLAVTAGADIELPDRPELALSAQKSVTSWDSSESEPAEDRTAPKPDTSGLGGAALPGLGGRTVFALANGNGSSSLVVSYFDADSFISVKNVGTTIVPVTVEYRDLAGNDRTPVSDSFLLIDNGTARWAPSAGSPPSNDSVGNPIPVMLGPETEGSVIITSTAPLVGQLEIERIDETIAYSLADSAASTSLVVPYLRTGSIIAVRNVGSATVNYVVEYRDLTGSIITTSVHSLAVNATDRFAPFVDEPGLVGVEASAIITGDQPLAGQLELAGSVNNSGYALQSRSGSITLVIPYVRAGSFIAITNSGAALGNFIVEYRDLAGGSLVTSPHALAAFVTERWAPFVDEPGVTGTEVSAVITSDQPLVGHLELRLPDGSTSASWLTAGTTPLAVPYMRPGSTIRVKCASGAATTLTVTYSSLAGAIFTAPPRPISAGATDGWDPFVEEPGLAGLEEASAAIVSSDPLAGQLELAPGEAPEQVSAANLLTAWVVTICIIALACCVLKRAPNAAPCD